MDPSLPLFVRGLRYLAHGMLVLVTPMAALAAAPGFLRAGGGARWGLARRGLRSGVAVLAGGISWPSAACCSPPSRCWPWSSAKLRRAPRPCGRWASAPRCSAPSRPPGWEPLRAPLGAHVQVRRAHSAATERGFLQGQRDRVAVMTEVGRTLDAHLPPRSTAVFGAIGAVGYASRLDLYDRHGLVTPEVGLRPVAPEDLIMPGHDKKVEIWHFLKDEPDVLFAALVARQGLTPAVRGFTNALLERQLQDRYAPQLLPTETGGALFLYRKVTAAEADAAWAAFSRAVAAAELPTP